MVPTVQLTIDCADPNRLAEFWVEALGYKLEDPPAGYASWDDWLRANNVPEDELDGSSVVDPDGKRPRIFFQKVPEGKVVKNRLHLDLGVSGGRDNPLEVRRNRVEAEASRLTGLGAKVFRVNEEDGFFGIVMQDPEGNEFCLH